MTTISTAVILYSQYQNEKQQIISDSRETLENQINIISQVLWNLDAPLANTILNSLKNTSTYTYISINDEQDNEFAFSGEKEENYSTSIELPITRNTVSKSKYEKIGTIKAHITTSAAIEHVKNNFLSITFAQIVKSFIISFLLLFLVYHVLIKHIIAINRYILEGSKTHDILEKPLSLERSYHNDELQRLVETINSSQKAHNISIKTDKQEKILLKKEIDKRKEAEETSRASHEQLLYVLNSLTQSVFSCKSDGEVQFMNHMALKLLSHHHTVLATTDTKLYIHDIVSICQDSTANSRSIDLTSHANKCTHITKLDAHLVPITGEVELTPIHITFVPTKADDKTHKQGFIIVISDETNQAKLREISYTASHDFLTKIYNRSYLTSQLNKILSTKEPGYCLAIIDLDKFKSVNDTYGHRAGDELLKLVSRTIPNSLDSHDVFARIGGDEFAILFHSTPERSLKKSLAIVSDIELLDFAFEDKILKVSCSIGITSIDKSDYKLETIMSHADQACYQVKRTGRGNAMLFKHPSKNVTTLSSCNENNTNAEEPTTA